MSTYNTQPDLIRICSNIRTEFAAIHRVTLALKEKAASHPIIKGRMRRVEGYKRLLAQQLGSTSATMLVNRVYADVLKSQLYGLH